MMNYTISDVAQRVGVSQSTVSLVINDRTNVSPDTRRRVLEAIEDMEYHPRHSARHLALAKGGSIGFVLTEQFFRVSQSRSTQRYCWELNLKKPSKVSILFSAGLRSLLNIRKIYHGFYLIGVWTD